MRGASKDSACVVIKCGERGRGGRVELKGCTITGARGTGLRLSGAKTVAILTDCKIVWNGDRGVYAHDEASGTLTRCVVAHNEYGEIACLCLCAEQHREQV